MCFCENINLLFNEIIHPKKKKSSFIHLHVDPKPSVENKIIILKNFSEFFCPYVESQCGSKTILTFNCSMLG